MSFGLVEMFDAEHAAVRIAAGHSFPYAPDMPAIDSMLPVPTTYASTQILALQRIPPEILEDL